MAQVIVNRILFAAANLYGLGTLLYLLVRLIKGKTWWMVALLDNGLHLILFPALILLVVMLIARRWTSAALMAPASLAFLIFYGGLFLPGWPSPAPACATGSDGCELRLRVMTYNLEHQETDVDQLISYLRETDADIVALSELAVASATRLHTDLIDLYPYQVSYGDGIPGIGLLSKYPITTNQHYALADASFGANIEATIEVNGRPLTVFSVHPIPPAMERTPSGGIAYQVRNLPEIQALAARVKPETPTLMMGDFNMVDQNPGHDMVEAAGLRDVFQQAGWGLGTTWPANRLALIRIDYIWISAEFRVERVWVGQSHGGDHLPVIADVVWRFR